MPADSFIPEPTLLVGIGGSGCAIIDRLLTAAGGSGRVKEHRIQVLGIDTDVEDLKHHTHLGPEHVLRIGATDDVYRMISRNSKDVTQWFLTSEDMTSDIRRMSVGTGAGQIRILSALAFTDSLNDHLIEDAIDRVVKGINQRSLAPMLSGPMNIVIVGSMAGGTGSGLFLPLAWLLIRKFRSLGGVVPVVRGLLLLGDVFCYAARLPSAQMDNVRTNSYAALAELNAALLESDRKLSRRVDFRHLNRGDAISKDNVPFDELILVDYNDSRGANLGPNINNYFNRCANILYNMIFTSVGSRYRSLFANEILSRSCGTACGQPKIYTGAGISELFYPRDDVLQYLSLCFARQAMQDDWLSIDHAFEERKNQWLERRKEGLVEPEPVRAQFYVDTIRARGRNSRNQFFREILEAVERPPSSEGAARLSGDVEATYQTFLSEFSRRLEEEFFKKQPRLASWRSGGAADAQSADSTLVQWVDKHEHNLNAAEAGIYEGLSITPLQIFRDAFMVKFDHTKNNSQNNKHDNVINGDISKYDIEYYILKDSPHPVQIRFFLYNLLLALDAELATLDSSDAGNRLISEAAKMAGPISGESGRAGNARSRRTYTADILERADKAVRESGFWKRRARRNFQDAYRRYYSDSARIIKQMIDHGLRRAIYSELRAAVVAMISELEELFKVIERLSRRIEQDINDIEDRYDDMRANAAAVSGTISRGDEQRAFWIGNIPVFASRDALRSIWADIDGSHKTRQSKPILEGLAVTLARRFRSAALGGNGRQASNYEQLFWSSVIDGYCRSTIREHAGPMYDFDVFSAVKREAAMLGEDWKSWLAERLNRLREQSAPLLAIDHEQSGNRIVMWALNNATAVQLLNRYGVDLAGIETDPALVSLFSVQPGDRLCVHGMYSPQKIVCINLRNNLELTSLVKLKPGYEDDHHNVSDPPEGRYNRAYNSRLKRLRGVGDRDGKAAGAVCTVTPHLHRDWHLPGYLPDIFDVSAQSWRDRCLRAFAQGLTLNVLKPNDGQDGDHRYVYDEAAWPGAAPDRRRPISSPRNDFDLYQSLDHDAELVDWIQTIYDKALQAALASADPMKTDFFNRHGAADLMSRIANIAVDARGDDTRTLSRQVTQSLLGMLAAFIDNTMSGSGVGVRRRKVRDTLAAGINKALSPSSPRTRGRSGAAQAVAGTQEAKDRPVDAARDAEQERANLRREILTEMASSVSNWQS